MAKKSKGLGMGLAALGLEDREFDQLGSPPPDTNQPESSESSAVRAPATVPLTAIRAGRYQPRNRFDDEALQSLAESIATHGVMQPIVLRALDAASDGKEQYEIIAGERRFRAARMAGLTEIPALIRQADNEQALAMALIENIQREDLNPLEEAGAIKRLIDEFSYTHETAAKAIGRSRSATTNLLRLLNLSPPVQRLLVDGELEMGHARALLVLSRADQIMLAHRVVERAMTVRETEAEVTAHLSNLNGPADDKGTPGPARRATVAADRDLIRMQNELSDILAAPVDIRTNARGRGKLVLHFSSAEQFDGLLEQLGLRKKLDKHG